MAGKLKASPEDVFLTLLRNDLEAPLKRALDYVFDENEVPEDIMELINGLIATYGLTGELKKKYDSWGIYA